MMKTIVLAVLVVLANSANAQTAQWTWESGKQTNNAATTLKSTSGSTATGLQNPTGTGVKINQAATTQPPTVVTTTGGDFSAKIWCGAYLPGGSPGVGISPVAPGVADMYGTIALGDYDKTTKLFTGYVTNGVFNDFNSVTGQFHSPSYLFQSFINRQSCSTDPNVFTACIAQFVSDPAYLIKVYNLRAHFMPKNNNSCSSCCVFN